MFKGRDTNLEDLLREAELDLQSKQKEIDELRYLLSRLSLAANNAMLAILRITTPPEAHVQLKIDLIRKLKDQIYLREVPSLINKLGSLLTAAY